MIRVPYDELLDVLLTSLLKLGFESDRALRCAQLFAESSRDGVQSHGLNRFPLFVSMIQSEAVDIHAKPVLVASSGPLERWDGKVGPGNLNAWLWIAPSRYRASTAWDASRWPTPITGCAAAVMDGRPPMPA
jgi:3-dehydro-L-gulonate 2-dehydrogenase